MTVDFAAMRMAMVEGQLRTYDVTDARLLAALETVPRERFVPENRQTVAYVDQPVTLSSNRSMLTPMVLARMIQMLEIEPNDHVLDVACGSGYSTALLAQLGGSVVALDDDSSSTSLARNILGLAGANSISFVQGRIEKGAADHGPFDVILINGALAQEPAELYSQLREGGRLAVVIGLGRSGRVMLYRKTNSHVSGRAMMDASAPSLAAFQKMEAFVF